MPSPVRRVSIKMGDNEPVSAQGGGIKRRKNGEKSVQVARKKLKDSGQEYTSSSRKLIPAKRPPNQEVSTLF